MTRYLFLGILILLPFQFALNMGENIDLVTTRVLIPAVFLLWLLGGLAQKKIWAANKAETWLVLSFLVLSALSLWTGIDPGKGTRKILYLLSIFPVYFAAADFARDAKFRVRMIRAVWASGALAAAVGIGQFSLPFLVGLDATLAAWRKIAPFFLGSSFGKLVTDNPSWLVNVSGKTWMRAFGFFSDPHMFSIFTSLCFFVGLGYFAWEKKRKWKILAGIGIAIMFFAIIFSFSRGAYLGVIMGSLFFLAVLAIRSGNAGKIAAGGAILFFLASVFFQGTIQSRLASAFNLKEGSNAERAKNWQQALGVTRDYPLSGVGLGNYASYIAPASGERSSIYAHNTFLDISAETGILNGLVFSALILAGLWRNVASKNFLNLGIASGLVYFLVHGFFDTPIWSPQVMVILLVLLAIGAAQPSRAKMVKRILAERKSKI
ncbi:MAG: O-antigen ligase family protein [Candidatus Moranbacteria bacterium]|nr:O-antigen ligase family protein [Candidatus Moranbacteria bacterium]